jgi:large subunit ribosomal protein L31
MKKGVHPEMFEKAKTTCTNCNTVFLIPDTVEEQQVEICRMCHPIYTGKVQKDLKGGRIDRFKKRLEGAKK